MLRLNTFFISHFSEKARWVLDFEGAEYRERCLNPGLHLLVTKRLGKKSSVPILEDGTRVIQGSSVIVDYLEAERRMVRLVPRAEERARCVALEKLADDAFGVGVQRICYDELLADRKTTSYLWALGGGGWVRAFYAVTYPGVAAAVKRMYDLRPEVVAEARQRFRAGIAEFDRELAGRTYLAGDGPTRIDVAVASLLGPVVRPPEHRVRWPELTGTVAEFMADFAGGPTFEHVLKMYREHRLGARPE